MDAVMQSDSLFAEVLLDYIETKACVHAADDDVYIKFLEKQALHINSVAIKQLQSTNMVATMRLAIDNEIENLVILGLDKLHSICLLVIRQPHPHFHIQHKWTMCNISGLSTSECIILGPSSEWSVDISYLPFCEMLWTVTNMDNIEFSKFTHFINSRPVTEKIMDSLIHIKQNKEYNPDTHITTYIRAFRTVLSTLRSTVAQHNQVKCPTEQNLR